MNQDRYVIIQEVFTFDKQDFYTVTHPVLYKHYCDAEDLLFDEGFTVDGFNSNKFYTKDILIDNKIIGYINANIELKLI